MDVVLHSVLLQGGCNANGEPATDRCLIAAGAREAQWQWQFKPVQCFALTIWWRWQEVLLLGGGYRLLFQARAVQAGL